MKEKMWAKQINKITAAKYNTRKIYTLVLVNHGKN